MLASPQTCQAFVENSSPEVIAQQLQRDEAISNKGGLPSLIVRYLPSASSQRAGQIAEHLFPQGKDNPQVLTLVYQGICTKLRRQLDNISASRPTDELSRFVSRPTAQELGTVMKVLDYFASQSQGKEQHIYLSAHQLLENHSKTDERFQHQMSPLSPSAFRHLKNHTSVDPESKIIETDFNQRPYFIRDLSRNCYICLYRLTHPHPEYRALCKQCGDFNIAERDLSLPGTLDLNGFNAVVTGARINLGFHTTLRLLRCGARVIATSRYPLDANERYRRQPDCDLWNERLRIVGADFRSAQDAFRLVEVIKKQVVEWGGRLHILINNAAQTLTDSKETEAMFVSKERNLHLQTEQNTTLLIEGSVPYQPRIRGLDGGQLIGESISSNEGMNSYSPNGALALQSKSSWMQSLQEIPYEDLITALAINSIVPVILIRELAMLMGDPASSEMPTRSTRPNLPVAHIINVSSREGLFETSPSASAKNGHHVHTNMSKAALNMITATEASPLWKTHRVAMNSVDPGYMSAAPEIGGECPISWEDGAGRVLWPIALAEGGREEGRRAVWGRFLKHFGAVEVVVRG